MDKQLHVMIVWKGAHLEAFCAFLSTSWLVPLGSWELVLLVHVASTADWRPTNLHVDLQFNDVTQHTAFRLLSIFRDSLFSQLLE